MNFKDTCKLLLCTLLVIIIWIFMQKHRLIQIESFEQKDENLSGIYGENINIFSLPLHFGKTITGSFGGECNPAR